MQAFFFCLLGLFHAHLIRQIEYLKTENQILRSRLGQEVHTRPEERRRLLKFGLPLGNTLKYLISIVSYQTFRRWVKQETAGQALASIDGVADHIVRATRHGLYAPVAITDIGWRRVPLDSVGLGTTIGPGRT